jgi:endonuclease G
MTNVCPQSPELNTGVWLKAERFLDRVANERRNIFVITGPIFGNNPNTVSRNPERKIHIPKAFYMIVADFTRYPAIARNLNLIAYRFPQDVSRQDDFANREKFGVSIYQIEQETGLNFFPEFTGKVANWENMESNVEKTHWKLGVGM